MLRALLWIQIVYIVYELHFPLETGIFGLNLVNMLFLATLFGVWLHKKDTVHPRAMLRSGIVIFFVTLIAAFFLAQARAPADFQDDITYLKTALFYPLLYFLYLHCRQDEKNTRWMIILVLVVAAVAGVQAIRQGLDYGIGTYVETHRASGPFGTTFAMANRAGVYYAMFLPMFIAIALMFRKQGRWRVAALAGIGILAFAILVTYSRQSYFIALVAAVVLFARRHLLLAVVLALALLTLNDYLPDSVTQRVAETRDATVSGDKYDVSTESRWEIWGGAMHMAQQYPLGVGLNRFQTMIGNYVPEYAGYDAHDFYVLTLCECGIFGLLALGWLLRRLFALAAFLRRSAPDDETRALALGFTVAVLCMAMGNFYGSPFLEGSVMGDFWILCGLLERYANLKLASAAAMQQTPAPARPPILATARILPPRATIPGTSQAPPLD
ncbi:MAG: O-antigen ligase family protein [Proteobacteria bacterium]|nr:O-antigen ligase family protein [Pseudomonadota bacterium]